MIVLVLIAAVVLSVVAGGGAVYVVVEWLPRVEDPAGHGLMGVYSFFAMGLYVVVSAVVYGIAVFRSDPERRLWRGLWALLTSPLLLLAFSAFDLGLNVDWKKEFVGVVRFLGPMWVVAAVQWVVLRWYIRRRAAANAGTTHG
jgi:hypothetical protein